MYKSIQACRAIAALLVVGFHLGGAMSKEKYFGGAADGVRQVFLFGGGAGVAFFFVLSGFIIVLTHRSELGRPDRLPRYLRKRIVRIYPTYIIIFVGVYLLAQVSPALSGGLPDDPLVLIKSLLLLPQDGRVVGGLGAPVIVVAWSLQYEVVFYACFALGMLSQRLGVVAAVAYVANLVYAATGDRSFLSEFIGGHLTLLFVLGACAALYVGSGRVLRASRGTALLAIAAFFGVGAAVDLELGLSKLAADLAYGVTGAVVVVALVAWEKTQPELFGHAGAVLLGNASYALYLIHFPLISIMCRVLSGLGLSGVLGVAVTFVVTTAACVGVSVVFHVVVERRVLAALSPRRPVFAQKG